MNNQKELNTIVGEDGQKLSPVLPEDVKNYLIDIDGTVTEDVPNEEPERMLTCMPFPDALKVLNRWYEEGHIITFFTSRTEEHRAYTEKWLEMHNFKYHGLLMDKPRGGNYHWIDNHLVKATRFRGKFTELVKKSKDIEVFNDDYISD
ncbi:MAG: phosphoheptose isomerase [Parvicellaceae bacterium]